MDYLSVLVSYMKLPYTILPETLKIYTKSEAFALENEALTLLLACR